MDPRVETALNEFLRSLLVCLRNAAIYRADHAVFIKSVDDFFKKTDMLLYVGGPIELRIGPHFLMYEDLKLEKDPVYEEIALFLHHRSLKSLLILKGVTLEEVSFFTSHVARRPQDILTEGGIQIILQAKSISHLTVEMLDYSQILKSHKGDPNIWIFLLRKALESLDLEQVEAVVENFHQFIHDVGVLAILRDEAVGRDILKFFDHLRAQKPAAFTHCGRILLEALVLQKANLTASDFSPAFQETLGSLKPPVLAEVILKRMFQEDKESLDALDVVEFLTTDRQKHSDIAGAMVEKIRHDPQKEKLRPRLQRVQEAMERSNSAIIREVYGPAFQELLSSDTVSGICFDREQVPLRFRETLLRLLILERDLPKLTAVALRVKEEWSLFKEEKDLWGHQRLMEVIRQSRGSGHGGEAVWQDLQNFVTQQLESMVLEGGEVADVEKCLAVFTNGCLAPEIYFNKIFIENRLNRNILRTLFKLHKEALFDFCEKITRKAQDTPFLLKLIEVTDVLNVRLRVEILKSVFRSPNPYVQRQVLQVMSKADFVDREFLFSLLVSVKASRDIKEQALRILCRKNDDRDEAVRIMLKEMEMTRGQKGFIKDNLEIIKRLGLKEVRDQLQVLRQRTPVWNRELKKEIGNILEQWKHEES